MSSFNDLRCANVRVTRHAVNRYRERSGSTVDDFQAARRLRDMLHDSHQCWLAPGTWLKTLKYHGPMATYHRHGGWIVVVASDMIKTVYPWNAEQWQKLPPKP